MREITRGRHSLLVLALVLAVTMALPAFAGDGGTASAATTYKYSTTVKYVKANGKRARITQFRVSNGMKGICCQSGVLSRSGTAEFKKLKNSSQLAKLAWYYGYERGWDGGENGVKLSKIFHYVVHGKAVIYKASTLKKWIAAAQDAQVPTGFVVYQANPTNGSQDFISWKYARGSLVIQKDSSDSKSLTSGGYSFEGIRFTIYESDQKTVYRTVTCPASGKTEKLTLGVGTWWVKETLVPKTSGYAQDTAWHKCVIKEGKQKSLTLKNKPKTGSAKIQKTLTSDSSGGSLEGFVFRLKNTKNGKVYTTSPTNSKGKVTLKGILFGTYRITEVLDQKQQKHYTAVTSTKKVAIQPGSVTSVSWKNRYDTHRSLKILKETDDGSSCQGFRFRVKYWEQAEPDPQSEPVSDQVYTTDETGTIQVMDIPAGTYTVEEEMTETQQDRYRQAPPQSQYIPEEGEGAFVFTFENQARRTRVLLRKQTEHGSITNIRFRLTGTTSFGEEIDPMEVTTNGDGIADFGMLYAGRYTAEELDFDEDHFVNTYPLEGYDHPAIRFDVTGEEDAPLWIGGEAFHGGAGPEGTVFLNQAYVPILLTKVDAEDQHFLPGATFSLTDSSGSTAAVFRIIAQEDGSADVEFLQTNGVIKGRPYTETEALSEDAEGDDAPEDPDEDEEDDAEVDDAQEEAAPAAVAAEDDGDDAAAGIAAGEAAGEAGADTEDQDAAADEEPDAVVDGYNDTAPYVMLTGLLPGESYTLMETQAPIGYACTARPVQFTAEPLYSIKVENRKLSIATTARDSETGGHLACADGAVKIIDTVTYTDLTPGQEYTLIGILMNKTKYMTTGDQEDVTDAFPGGRMTRQTKTFTPQQSSGTVDMTFSLDASHLAGVSAVVYEELYDGSHMIASHVDPEDEGQSIHFPKASTTARDTVTGEHIALAEEDMQIVDTVAWSGLLPGKTYQITGVLMDQRTGKPVTRDGVKVTATQTIHPDSASGSTDLVFTLDARDLQGHTLVAFETVSWKGHEVAVHADLHDRSQSVRIPKAATEAALSSKDTITDVIRYENLIPGRTYTVAGVLMDQKTGEETECTASGSFTPEKSHGSTQVRFSLDENLRGRDTLVAFETVRLDEHIVAQHRDLEDEAQSVKLQKSIASPPSTGDAFPGIMAAAWMVSMLGTGLAAAYHMRRRKGAPAHED